VTLDIHDDGNSLRANYRFYSVLGDPDDPLITLLWEGEKRGQGIRG
jgi:tartrate-resistant acid phosphatase type 5